MRVFILILDSLLKAVRGLLIIIVLVGCLLFFLVNTHQGLLMILQAASSFLPGTLELTGVQGQLLYHIRIEHLQYTNGSTRLELDNTEINWHFQRVQPYLSGIITSNYRHTPVKVSLLLEQNLLRLNVDKLNFLSTLNPEISDVHGQLEATVDLSGAMLQGRAQLKHGSITLKKPGIILNAVELDLHKHGHHWKTQGALVWNGKTLQLNGQGSLAPKILGSIHISGENLPVMNTFEYQIEASPQLNIDFTQSTLAVKGSIIIPKAQLKPQSFSDTVNLPDDAVFVEDTVPVRPLPITTDIQIHMGEEVTLAVKGLQGRLRGDIHLSQTPESPLKATGELTIEDGKYQAYGQDLIINQGRLIFTGHLPDNPALYIRAIRQFKKTNLSGTSSRLFDFNAANLQSKDFGRNATVGIEVSGQLKTPKISLFSNPSTLSQADILSMLLLGKPASEANKSGGQLLMTAITSMNLGSDSKGLQMLSQLKQSLGVDFNIENTTSSKSPDGKTSVVLGKSLSKKLYLSYNMGLSQTDANVLNLKYLLSRFFSLQVSAGAKGRGVDLLYTRN